MFGPDFSTGAAAITGIVPVLARGPQPAQRVVESTARSALEHSDLQQLSKSAREFADLLDTTGDVQVALAISGFRAGHLDMYV